MSTDPKDNIEEIDENADAEEIISEEAEEETVVLSAEETEEETQVLKADEEDEAAEEPALAASAKAGAGGEMSASTKALVVVLVIALLGGGLLFWKFKVAAHNAPMTKISREDMEFLLKDAPPQALKSLENPETKKKQIESLKQMLALANAAKRAGLTEKEDVKIELEDLRTQIVAVNYDREINKGKGPMPPFGFIGEDRMNEFWGAPQEPGGFVKFLDSIKLGWIVGEADKRRREADFKAFFNAKIESAKEAGQIPKDREPSEEETKQARDYYAKTRIYAEEAETKKKEMSAEFTRKVNLSVGLQQAQYLSRLYAEKELVEKTKVTDEDVEKYLAEHPELAVSPEIKTKAEEVLNRAKQGEDFAALAKEFSEDPGSKEKGGLYENVPPGQMVPEFEQAALALEPGQIAPNLIESKFGYHIIKLESKDGEAKVGSGETQPTYNVRHILFLTTVKDPSNPMSQPMSPKDMARTTLETEKEKTVLDDVLKNNPVEVAEDFTVPQVSPEQMQQMMQQQMQQQMPQELTEEGEKPSTSPKGKTKPEPKKK